MKYTIRILYEDKYLVENNSYRGIHKMYGASPSYVEYTFNTLEDAHRAADNALNRGFIVHEATYNSEYQGCWQLIPSGRILTIIYDYEINGEGVTTEHMEEFDNQLSSFIYGSLLRSQETESWF